MIKERYVHDGFKGKTEEATTEENMEGGEAIEALKDSGRCVDRK
jgi:hypothetical protein